MTTPSIADIIIALKKEECEKILFIKPLCQHLVETQENYLHLYTAISCN